MIRRPPRSTLSLHDALPISRISAEYRMVEGQVRRSKKMLSIRGLNKDHNHDLKGLFKGAATMASAHPDRKSTRLNSSHLVISYAVFCLKKKKPLERSSMRED